MSKSQAVLKHLHARFLAIVSRIETHGQVYFRHLKCQHSKEEAIADMVALCWKWFVRLHERGRDPAHFVSTMASFAARAVKSGRRVHGQEKPRDVLSETAQRRHNFVVGRLPDFSTLTVNPLTEALIENTQSPPDEQAAFRIDFTAWLCSLDDRKRRIATDLMMGERTQEAARRYQCSSARISQMRREFSDDWQRFCT